MHAHIPDAGSSAGTTEDVLFLYLANNITVIRGTSGSPDQLELRRKISIGDVLGPTIFVGSPPLSGSNARSPDTAERLMYAYRSAGYDFLKIHPGVPIAAWDRIAESAHSVGFTFGGHVPDAVGLRHALSTGVSVVDHLDGYLREVASDDVRSRLRRGEDVPLGDVLESVEGRRMRAIAAHTRSSHTWVVPTLHLWENLYRPLNLDSVMALPELALVPVAAREEWIRQKMEMPQESRDVAEDFARVRGRILRALQMAGVGILLGTDSPQMFNVPGFSLRNEIRSMALAGLTPYEILVSGTRNVAEYVRDELRREGDFGTVEPANRADLVLLRGNPLEDLDHLWNQEGVMVRGRWLPRDEIDRRLAGIAERHRER
jgi:hypothetical protein